MSRKRVINPIVVVGAYALVMVLVGWFVILFNLPHSLLLVAIVPAIVSALFFGRLVYLSMIFIGTFVSIWVTYQISSDFRSSLLTIFAGLFSVLVVTEITYTLTQSRQKVVVALQESEVKYRTLVEMFPYPILILQNERIIFANPATLEMVGYERIDELLGEDMFARIPEDERPRLEGYVRRRLRGDKDVPEHYETVFIRENGDEIPIEVFVRPIIYQGEPAVQAIVMDITEQVHAQTLLRESEERYRSISEVSSDFAYMASVGAQGEFVIEWVAGAFQQITGYSAQELTGLGDWFYLIPYEDAEVATKHRRRVLAGLSDVAEFRIDIKGGGIRWVHHSAKPVVDEVSRNIKYLYGAVQDITERMLSDEARQITTQKLRVWVDDLEQRRREDGLLIEMGGLLQSCLTEKEVYSVVGQYSIKLFENQHGILGVFDDDGQLITVAITWGDPLTGEDVFSPDDCWALRRGRTHVFAPPRRRLRCPHMQAIEVGPLSSDNPSKKPLSDNEHGLPALRSSICVPINAQGETLGLLHLQFGVDQSHERWEQLAVAVADRAALALANLKLRQSLRDRVIHDSLTGLFNRRYMVDTLYHELRRATLYERSMGVLLLDIDNFKRINDHFGTAAGDALLEGFGELLKAHQGPGESAGRYGGDSFLLILPNLPLDETHARAENLRGLTSNIQVQYLDHVLGDITISIGVAAYPQHGTSAEEVLHAVETALYHAKDQGRDRVFLAV